MIMPGIKTKKLISIDRFINEQEDIHPGATGEFTSLMHDFTLAIRIISHEVRKAGLNNILGMTGSTNVHGEHVRKIDEFADEIIINTMKRSGKLTCMISEEHKEFINIPEGYEKGKYILAFDPIDGSTNIDVNITIGTIFSLYKSNQNNGTKKITETDLLLPGSKQVAAGYVLYGSSTILVYTTGNGVNVFTFDPDIGEFLLTMENLKIPHRGKMYSCNEGNFYKWEKWVQQYVRYLKTPDSPKNHPYNFRYVASAVADIHRTIENGGIYLYPKTTEHPNGKIRLLYEANPLAWIVEQANGYCSDGEKRILDIIPKSIHQTVPFFIGSKEDVNEAEIFQKGKHPSQK
jgi:fructose-1,6-bisphosphatase I